MHGCLLLGKRCWGSKVSYTTTTATATATTTTTTTAAAAAAAATTTTTTTNIERISGWPFHVKHAHCAEQVQIQKCKIHACKTLKRVGVQIIMLKHPNTNY